MVKYYLEVINVIKFKQKKTTLNYIYACKLILKSISSDIKIM